MSLQWLPVLVAPALNTVRAKTVAARGTCDDFLYGVKAGRLRRPAEHSKQATDPALRPWRVSTQVRKIGPKREKSVGAARIDPEGSSSDVSGA